MIKPTRDIPKEPEQEPVAWRFRSGNWFNREVHWRYINTLEGTEGLLGLQPLYITPPQRKPLTDEMVTAAARELNKRAAEACNVDEADSWNIYGDEYIEDARAVLEAAHGIKE